MASLSKELEHFDEDIRFGLYHYFKIRLFKDFSESSTLLKTFTRRWTLQKKTYSNLAIGTYYFALKKYEKANRYFLRSEKFDIEESNKWLYLELYYSNIELENITVSEHYLQKALKIDSNFITARLELSNLFYRVGKVSDALEVLNNINNNSPNFRSLVNMGSILIDQKQYTEAKFYFNKSLDFYENTDAYIGLSYILIHGENDYCTAKKLLNQAILMDKNNSIAYYWLGYINLKTSDFTDAIKNFEQSVLLEPNLKAYLNLIYTLTLINSFDIAIKYLNKARTLYPDNYELDFWEVLLLSLVGDFNNGQKKSNQYLEKHSFNEINWFKNELKKWGVTFHSISK